jgi:hypothetical protein
MHFSFQMAGGDTSLSMLLVLLAAVTLAEAKALTNRTLTTDHLHTVLCFWTVALTHFAPGRPLIVSLPRTSPDVSRSALSELLPQTDNLQTVKALQGMLNEGTRWPIEMFRPSGDDTADILVLNQSYIVFVWNEEAGSLNETLKNQVEYLKYSTSWNPRGRILMVATEISKEPPRLLAVHV